MTLLSVFDWLKWRRLALIKSYIDLDITFYYNIVSKNKTVK